MISTLSTELAHKVLGYFQEQQEAMLGLLQQLVEFETPTPDHTANEELLKKVGQWAGARGFPAHFVPGSKSGGMLLIRPKDRPRPGKFQLLLGHIDTVWPHGTLQRLSWRTEEGKIYGPGIFDMKAGLVLGLSALEAIKKLNLEPPFTPIMFINSDEETGSHDSTTNIRRLAAICERAFVMEPPLGPTGRLKTTRKGVGRYTIEVGGVAAHAGLDPGKGASAIQALSQIVQGLFALNDLERGITVNVGTIEGGNRPNVVADKARAVVDVRVPTMKIAQEVDQAIRNLSTTIPQTKVMVEGRIGRPPLEPTPPNRKLWAEAQKAAEMLGFDLEESSAGGGSDGNTTSQYCATLDGLGVTGDGAHAEHEHIQIPALTERAALLTMLLLAKP